MASPCIPPEIWYRGHVNRRLEQWVKGSHAVAHTGLSVPSLVQRLGEMDCELIESEAKVTDAITRARATGDSEALLAPSIYLTRIGFQAHLWVLGAYEVVRVINEKMPAETGEAGFCPSFSR